MNGKTKPIVIELLVEYYPIYKNICQDIGEQPSHYACICWMIMNDILKIPSQIQECTPAKPNLVKDVIDNIRDHDIIQKGWNTKRQQNNNEMEQELINR